MKFFSSKNKKATPAKKESAIKKDSKKLSKKELEDLLAASYNPKTSDIGSYKVDKSLSNKRVQVYQDPNTGHTVVAHRGSATKTDWAENALYATTGLKIGSNWSHSKKIQKKAEKKYGTENLSTIGHSKGALHAQEYGKNSGEILTLNKPVNVRDIMYKVPKKQTDYTGEGDVVSALRSFQRGNKAVTLKKEISFKKRIGRAIKHPLDTILKEHSTDTLRRKDNTQTIPSYNSPSMKVEENNDDTI